MQNFTNSPNTPNSFTFEPIFGVPIFTIKDSPPSGGFTFLRKWFESDDFFNEARKIIRKQKEAIRKQQELKDAEHAMLVFECSELKNENELLRSDKVALARSVSFLEEKNTEFCVENDVLYKEKVSLESMNEFLSSDKALLARSASELHEENATLEDANGRLKNARALLLSDKAALDRTNAELYEKNTTLETANDKLHKEQVSLESMNEILRGDKECLRNSISGLEDSNAVLSKQLDDANAELGKDFTVCELKEKFKDVVAYSNARNGEIDVLEEELKDALEACAAYNKNIVIQNGVIENLKKQLSEKKEDLSSLRGTYVMAETDHQEKMACQVRRGDKLADKLQETFRISCINAKAATVAKRELREANAEIASLKIDSLKRTNEKFVELLSERNALREGNDRLICDARRVNELLMASNKQLSLTAAKFLEESNALKRCEEEKKSLEMELAIEESVSADLRGALRLLRVTNDPR